MASACAHWLQGQIVVPSGEDGLSTRATAGPAADAVRRTPLAGRRPGA